MKFVRELFRSCVLDDIKDSAGGSAKQGRDPATQAIIPIRGKIINVEKEDLQKVLKNEEVKSIINAIGAGFLDTFDVNKMRYGKIIIATDSDIDAVGDQIPYRNWLNVVHNERYSGILWIIRIEWSKEVPT